MGRALASAMVLIAVVCVMNSCSGGDNSPEGIVGKALTKLQEKDYVGYIDLIKFSETDAEKRTARKRGRTDRVDKACPLQTLHRALRRADSGKDDSIRRDNDFGVIRHRRRLADRRECQLHAGEIPCPVIDNCRHRTIPAFLSL